METETDPFDLNRFLDAQSTCYERVLGELQATRKMTHWIWFIFPQIAGLGRSETARMYAIESLEEASAYLAHPILGPRLIHCSGILLELEERSISRIMGFPDDLKLRSSMTLFSRVENGPSVFREVLEAFYDGQPDQLTLDLLPGKA